jgi:hypothetical protein
MARKKNEAEREEKEGTPDMQKSNVSENAEKIVVAGNCELEELQQRRRLLAYQAQAVLSDFANCGELNEVENKIAELVRRIEWAKLAMQEGQAQTKLSTETRKVEALNGLKAMLDDFDKQQRKLFGQISKDPNPSTELLNNGMIVARQAHALACELFSITKDQKFHRRWDSGLLERYSRRMWKNPLSPKTRVPSPWRELLEIARREEKE